MAKTSETAAATDGRKGAGLLVGVIVPVLILTIVAGAGGWLIGMQITSAKSAVSAETAGEKAASATAVKELPPIVTNLAAPEGAWVRLQAAIIYDKADAAQIDVMAGKVVDDTMAFVKTLTVTQLQGASGLQHLREDLNERASLRSDGHIREMMIEMLVVE